MYAKSLWDFTENPANAPQPFGEKKKRNPESIDRA